MTLRPALNRDECLFATVTWKGAEEYCREHNVSVSGGLVASLFVDVIREYWEPIEDEL